MPVWLWYTLAPHRAGRARGWLAGFYVAVWLLFDPVKLLVVLFAAIADSWLNFRQRWSKGRATQVRSPYATVRIALTTATDFETVGGNSPETEECKMEVILLEKHQQAGQASVTDGECEGPVSAGTFSFPRARPCRLTLPIFTAISKRVAQNWKLLLPPQPWRLPRRALRADRCAGCGDLHSRLTRARKASCSVPSEPAISPRLFQPLGCEVDKSEVRLPERPVARVG